MDRVKSQAAVVSQLLFDPKTAGAYKNVLTLTWKIIKEVFLLVWLLICSVLVFGAWFSDVAIGSGRKARAWWQTQQTETTDGNQAAAATGQAFLDVSQTGANFLVDKAREQLGLEKVARSVKTAKMSEPVKPEPKPTAKKSAPTTADQVAPIVKGATVDKKSSDTKAEAEAPVPEKH